MLKDPQTPDELSQFICEMTLLKDYIYSIVSHN